MSKNNFKEKEKAILIKDIQEYFSYERDENLSIIEANDLLVFFAEKLGSIFYNKGIFDAKKIAKNLSENIEFDIDALRR